MSEDTRQRYTPANPGPVAHSFSKWLAENKQEELTEAGIHGHITPHVAQALFSFHGTWQRWRNSEKDEDGLTESDREKAIKEAERAQAKAQTDQEKADRAAKKQQEKAERDAKKGEDDQVRAWLKAEREFNRDQKKAVREQEREQKAAEAAAKKADREAKAAAAKAEKDAAANEGGEETPAAPEHHGSHEANGEGAGRSKLRKPAGQSSASSF